MTTDATNDGIPVDLICMYCSNKAGMSADACSSVTARRVAWLLAEGCIELRERTINLPAVNMPESCKQVAMFDTWSARTVTLRTYHLLRWPDRGAA